ncbi:MAG: branched-chain amino acid ABC transporter permease [Burkholderiales bacterium]|nr:MAG: branched-chain amino acid ABC transporter permease [Burkholderiales bacterium]
MALVHRWVGPALVLALLLLPLGTDKYTQYVINLIMIYVIIGIGLNFLLGFAGQFAFAHAALMGIGAYTVALLTHRLGVSFWLALPAAGILATLIGSIAALPAMRMKRVYLALVTLAFAELIQWVFIHWKTVTLGTDGVPVPTATLVGARIHGDHRIAYVILVITVLMYVLGRRIVESKIGRSLVAIRENEIVAQCNGINIARTKALVFSLSAFYAGIGGGLFALALGFIVPDGFGLFQLVVHFSLVVIGGLISMYGSVIGAVVLTALPEVLRDFQWLQEIIYGFMLVVFILFMPHGVAGLGKRIGILPDEVLVRGWRRLAAGKRPGAGREGGS